MRKLPKDLLRAMMLGPRGWHDLVRAAIELAIANRRLRREPASALLAPQGDHNRPEPFPPLTGAQQHLVARVAFAVPRLGKRVPWRSDCLRQALAAQRWLAGSAIASTICIGAQKDDAGAFGAHAWLKVGDVIVTGGDIAGYVPLISPDAPEQPIPSGG